MHTRDLRGRYFRNKQSPCGYLLYCGGATQTPSALVPANVKTAREVPFLGLLESYPTLSAQDLANAWAYVRAHRLEIDSAIKASEAD